MRKTVAYLLLFLMTFVQPAQAALALQDWTSRRELYRQIHQGGHNDGNGQRVQKTVNGVTQKFLWNGSNIAKEYKADGSVRADYQLGAGAKIDGKWQFYLTDIQGSTLGVADDTGKVIATWAYSDYGETTQTSGDKNLHQPFLYAGKELDPETGWYHNKARHYAPKFGKFLSRDALGNANRYQYCNGDPINLIDSSGLAPQPYVDEVRDTNPYQVPASVNGQFGQAVEIGAWTIAISITIYEATAFAIGTAGYYGLQRMASGSGNPCSRAQMGGSGVGHPGPAPAGEPMSEEALAELKTFIAQRSGGLNITINSNVPGMAPNTGAFESTLGGDAAVNLGAGATRFVVNHELGHLVNRLEVGSLNFMGMSPAAKEAFVYHFLQDLGMTAEQEAWSLQYLNYHIGGGR